MKKKDFTRRKFIATVSAGSVAAVVSNSIPVFTALFSFLLFGEKLTIQNIAGMAIVITGLFMSQMNGRKKSIDEALILTGKTA